MTTTVAGFASSSSVDESISGGVKADTNYMTSVLGVFAASVCVAGNRWWSGPFTKAAKPLAPSINI